MAIAARRPPLDQAWDDSQGNWRAYMFKHSHISGVYKPTTSWDDKATAEYDIISFYFCD